MLTNDSFRNRSRQVKVRRRKVKYHLIWNKRKGNKVATLTEQICIKIGIDQEDLKTKGKKLIKNEIKSTKYTLITFLPQNLLEQFRRIANFYFLVMSVVALSIDAPVSPLTSVAPLVFVISVTAVKQAYEDFLRYRTDKIVNESLVAVIRDGVETNIMCKSIRQGDLVIVPRDCDVPCDLVLIKSSDPERKCHITTANLDGETNLKTLHVPKGLPDLENDKLRTLGEIECEPPQPDLYTFTGRVNVNPDIGINMNNSVDQLDGTQLPLMTDNLLLRGSKVRNTEWVIGCAVYTGPYTKLALNSRLTRNKMSSSEKWINRYLVFFLILLVASVTVSYILKRFYDARGAKHNAYLGESIYKTSSEVRKVLQDYLSFLMLYNYLIPISLYVTIELQKFLGSFFMEWDIELYDAETDQPFIVNTSDLNEELGQVNILFSDKTGTLTKNIMAFQQCSINGKRYRQGGRGLQEHGKTFSVKLSEASKYCYDFFEALALCHTVQVAGKLDLAGVDDGIHTKFINLDEESETSDDRSTIDRSTVKYTFDGVPLNSVEPKTDIPDETLAGEAPLLNGNARLTIHPIPTLSFTEADERRRMMKEALKMTRTEQLKRTFSDGQDRFSGSALTHRRTHSDQPSFGPNHDMVDAEVNLRRNSSSARSSRHSRTQTREYYAMESYTTDDLLERRATILRSRNYVTLMDQLDYQASSPDEKALVEACGRLGMIFTGDDNDIIQLKLSADCIKKKRTNPGDHEILLFKRLQVLEFTSDRKRMSVIVQDKNRQIWVYTKGAESHVLPLCTGANTANDLVETTQKHIDEFAKEGLRTLALARKKLTKEQYNQFTKELLDANNSLTDRVRLVEECQQRIESGLELLGATAVEDALQDDVRDVLVSLREAKIKIWVLTGDKIETALNIAYSCGHIPDHATKYFITHCTDKDEIVKHFDYFAHELHTKRHLVFALLIDGVSLGTALEHAPQLFRDLAIQCHAVLCCRLSPLQKCEVVKLMKTEKSKPICASIGDGANDVSMIQEAHVGIGIVGKEGRQAARCSDYAIAKFSMIKKMLLVHGHYFSDRLSIMVLYFFYKNFVFMAIQLAFQSASMYSTQSIYDSIFLTLYNTIYTAVPVLILALTEKAHPEERLLTKPLLYLETASNRKFKWHYFNQWMALAMYHSVIIYCFTFYLWDFNAALLPIPQTAPLFSFGTCLIQLVVVVVSLKLLLKAKYKTHYFTASIILSIIFFGLSTYIYNILPIGFDGDFAYSYNKVMISISCWLLMILVVVACLMPDFFLMSMKAFGCRLGNLFPSPGEMTEKIRYTLQKETVMENGVRTTAL